MDLFWKPLSFSENHLLFTIDWPSSIIESMSVTSVWHLDISNAEHEIICNLMTASAEKMGMKNWKIVTVIENFFYGNLELCKNQNIHEQGTVYYL